MGDGPHKTHEADQVAPAAAARLADAVDARDDRPAGAAPLAIDTDALDTALAAVGVEVGPQTHIKLRLRAQNHPGEQGMAQKLGPDQYRVVIKVADKPAFADRHLYVVNNSLLCGSRDNRDYADLRIMPMRRCNPRLRRRIETARSG